jgi:hypothetical protein
MTKFALNGVDAGGIGNRLNRTADAVRSRARRLNITDPDRCPAAERRVVHSLVDMFRARMFAISCGYEDADDLDHLRSDPAFKLASTSKGRPCQLSSGTSRGGVVVSLVAHR